jgi:hypothetical protein
LNCSEEGGREGGKRGPRGGREGGREGGKEEGRKMRSGRLREQEEIKGKEEEREGGRDGGAEGGHDLEPRVLQEVFAGFWAGKRKAGDAVRREEERGEIKIIRRPSLPPSFPSLLPSLPFPW